MRRHRPTPQPCSRVQRQRRHAKDRTGQDKDPGRRRYGFARADPEKGHGGRLGAEPGDLLYLTNVGKHKFLERKGDNVYITVPITVPEAALGTKIEVPTVEGKAQFEDPGRHGIGTEVSPARTRISNLRNPNLRGDQFVEVKITLPRVISEETKEVLREFEKLNPENPRKAIGLE